MENVFIFAIIMTTAIVMSLWSMRPFLNEIKNGQKKKNNIPSIQIIDVELQAQRSVQQGLKALKNGQIQIMVYEKIWMHTGATHIIYSDTSQSIWQQQDSTAYEIIEAPNNEKKIEDIIAEQNIITYQEKLFYHSRRYVSLNNKNQNNIPNKTHQWKAFINQTHTPYVTKIHQTELEKILF